jgi:poly-gamma-glutamate synthesis protein (capsule biosynthesis protein)
MTDANENRVVSEDAAIDTIRLVFAGDVMGHSTQINGAWKEGDGSRYNFIPTFQYVKDYFSIADIAIANLEVTFAGEPYTGYPRFSSPESLAEALQKTGFDILTTANNHILDNGRSGLESTIDVLDKLGVTHTGSFKDSAVRKSDYPLIVAKNGFKLAFLSYTYGSNMGRARLPNIVNFIDSACIEADLAKARRLKADYIIACVHWGDEYKNMENEAQRQTAAFLAENGCHLIIGAHPHVVQPIKKIAGRDADSVLVAYSLGNLISNQRWRYSNGGIALDVTLVKTGDKTRLYAYNYKPLWVYRYPNNGAQAYRLIPVDDYILHPEHYPALNAENKRLMMEFYEDTKRIVKK